MGPSQPLPTPGTGKDLHHRVLALLEVLLVALAGPVLVQIGFILLNVGRTGILGDTRILFLFMASEACITLFAILLFLRLRGESLRNIGWIWNNVSWEVLLGIGCVPLLFGSTFLVGIFFSLFLPEYVSTSNPLLELIESYGDLLLFLISSIYVGGIKEEIQRAFVLDRFERYLGAILLMPFSRISGRSVSEQAGRRVGIILGLILWSLFFAFGHALQGIDNAVGAGILGVCFGLLYIWRRNLVAPMVAHALFDVATLLIFWFVMTQPG
jgi:membrane protease YdiL (CAAX protease family)